MLRNANLLRRFGVPDETTLYRWAEMRKKVYGVYASF